MKIKHSEIILIALTLIFMALVFAQSYFTEDSDVPVFVETELQAPEELLLIGGDGDIAEENTGPININTADVETLDMLPGIGEGIAQRIIDYRNENGNFEKTEDIMNVSGIGEKTFEEIKDLIICETD